MKRLVLILLAALMLLAVSCGEKVEEVEYKEAESSVNAFLDCLKNDRYDDAVELMHSGFYAEAGEIQVFVESKEVMWGLDFADMTTPIYKNFEPSYYDASFSGSFYRLSGTFKLEEYTVSFYFDVAKFKGEYGISNFDFTLVADK